MTGSSASAPGQVVLDDANSWDQAFLQPRVQGDGRDLQPWPPHIANDNVWHDSELDIPALTPDVSLSDHSPQVLSLPLEFQPDQYSTFPTDTVAGPMPACACLSTLYLTLSTLQSLPQPLTFPYALHPLRDAISTASNILACQECPKRFITGMQNTQLLGTLLVSIAERFSAILKAIDAEAQRAETAGEAKKFRLADLNTSTSHLHTGGMECTATFHIDMSPDEWRRMCKKVVRAEVLGDGGSGQCCPCFVAVVERMEKRQEEWHERKSLPEDCPPAKGFDPGERRAIPKEGRLCLKMVQYARGLVDALQWE